MDVNFLTIADALAGHAGLAQASSRPEPSKKASQPFEGGGEKPIHANSHQLARADNATVSDQREPVDKTPKEFKQTLREKQTDSNLQKAPENAKPKEKPSGSKTADQPDLVQSWLVQNSIPVENAGKNSVTKVEPKAGRKLAELIPSFKGEKSPPVTGQAAKSAEVKLLEPSEKVQAGLKTVLPEKSQGLNGLKGVPVGSPKSVPASQTSAHMPDDTGETPESNQKDLAAKMLANAGQAVQLAGSAEAVPTPSQRSPARSPVWRKFCLLRILQSHRRRRV